jgi:hypothetical protein
MTRFRRVLRALLSLVVPGLGQLAAGHSARGGAILAVVIVVGNLNAIFLSAYAITMHEKLPFFAGALARLLHDVFAFYGVVFWIWQAADAYGLPGTGPSQAGAR